MGSFGLGVGVALAACSGGEGGSGVSEFRFRQACSSKEQAKQAGSKRPTLFLARENRKKAAASRRQENLNIDIKLLKPINRRATMQKKKCPDSDLDLYKAFSYK